MTQVDVCMATSCCAIADHPRQRLAAHRRYKLHTDVEVTSGNSYAYQHSQVPEIQLKHACVAMVATLTGEVAWH